MRSNTGTGERRLVPSERSLELQDEGYRALRYGTKVPLFGSGDGYMMQPVRYDDDV